MRQICSTLLLLFVSGCGMQIKASTPVAGAPPLSVVSRRSLADVPVFVGEMTFNEFYNRGFTEEYNVVWESDDLAITTDGRISGTFRVHCDGPMASISDFSDALFVAVVGTYIYPEIGDLMGEPLSDVIPVLAEASEARSARFRVESTFEIPQLVNDVDGGMPLESLAVTLTWVRLYRSGSNAFVQVFAGDASRYPPIPEIKFDEAPRMLTGRFGYYEVLKKDAVTNGTERQPNDGFDYFVWLLANTD